MRVTVPWEHGRHVQVGTRAVPEAFELSIDRENGSPVLALGFEVRDGLPQCRRAELRSTDEGREVLSSDLRGVRVEDLLEQAVGAVAMLLDDDAERGVWTLEPVTTGGELRGTLAETRRLRRQARRRVTDELLREVAEVYRAHVDDAPTRAVAERTGRSHRTAALYVQQARQAGFLGAATHGRAGES